MNCKYCKHGYIMHVQLVKRERGMTTPTQNTFCMECEKHCLMLWEEAKREDGK